MAHFAQIDENNIVTKVIIVDDKDTMDPFSGQEDEMIGIVFCKKTFGGNWIQTSYNGSIRARYASIGYTYDKTLDAFIPPKPYSSWILDLQTFNWKSPLGDAPTLTTEEIESGSFYIWDEDLYQSDNSTGWIKVSP